MCFCSVGPGPCKNVPGPHHSWSDRYGVLISISATFQGSGNVADAYVDVIVRAVPAAGTPAVVRCTQKVLASGLNWPTTVWPAGATIVRAACVSVPTMNTSELARVVVSVAAGARCAPLAALAIAVAAPSSGEARENVTTRIEFDIASLSVAVTVMAACAGVVNAHQISAVPDWWFDHAARVQVRAEPVFVTLLTAAFPPTRPGPRPRTRGPAEMNATINVLASGVMLGLVFARLSSWVLLTFCTIIGALFTVTVTG